MVTLMLILIGMLTVASSAAEAPTVGTWFDGLGSPYGGCGVPQDLLETQYFVALNVYNLPGSCLQSGAVRLHASIIAFP